MADELPLQAVVTAFASPDGAADALKQLRGSDANLVLQAAVLVRGDDGEIKIQESHHVARGAVIGGVAGAVVGLIAGPVGWVALGGAGIGALASRLRDSGFPDDRLRHIGEGLKPGTSALVAIVADRQVIEAEAALRDRATDITVEAIKADVAAQLDEDAPAVQ